MLQHEKRLAVFSRTFAHMAMNSENLLFLDVRHDGCMSEVFHREFTLALGHATEL